MSSAGATLAAGARMGEASTEGALERWVEARRRLRRAWDPSRDRGPWIVAGRPSAWSAALEAVRAEGDRVIGFVDLLWQHRRPLFRRRPVWPGRWPFPSPVRWLFAGTPRKRFFDGAPPPLARCRWQVPLAGWRQRGRRDPAYLEAHADGLRAVFARLADDASRATYASLIRGRLEGDAGYFAVAPHREYDHPVVRAAPGEVVIDAGAYDGDSARRFAWRMRGLGTVVALEPDPVIFQRLQRRRIPGLRPVRAGAWSHREVLSFAAAGSSGRIVDGGEVRVDVDAIDAIVEARRLRRVDLIKLDVEGAEARALDGAARTLARHRPKLQVSIYHRPRDLFELPRRLMETLDGYDWYVAHHGPWHTETDLYGMPRERRSGAGRARWRG
ncbi:MAG TPA: FkbM family methyltransferase [Sandaracinaceae bacterium LLY-WYZ-13_1]|nr:FkbM family methyltransferase [Sandaracinaceae bacterium LLY-WYZ-13_1]